KSSPRLAPMILSDQLADYAEMYHPVERQILDQMVTQLYEIHQDNLIHFCLELYALFHRQMPSNLISALVYQSEIPYDPPERPVLHPKIKNMAVADFHTQYGEPRYTWENRLYDLKLDELGLYKSQLRETKKSNLSETRNPFSESLSAVSE